MNYLMENCCRDMRNEKEIRLVGPFDNLHHDPILCPHSRMPFCITTRDICLFKILRRNRLYHLLTIFDIFMQHASCSFVDDEFLLADLCFVIDLELSAKWQLQRNKLS